MAEGAAHRRREIGAHDFDASAEARNTDVEPRHGGRVGVARALECGFQEAEGNSVHRYYLLVRFH